MQLVTSKEYITLEGKDKVHKLEIKEYSRWLCLIEGIFIIQRKAEQINIKIQNLDWIKPLSFQKFIEERVGSMQETVERHEKPLSRKKKICATLLAPVLP